MNLLAKRAKWLVLSVSILSWGCKEDVGIELPPDVQRTEVKYAEFTLPVTNVYFDSLRTDSRGVAFLGEYSDAVYGTISAKMFSEYRFKSGDIVSEITVVRGSYDETIEDITFEKAQLFLDISEALSSSNSISLGIEISSLADSIFADGLYLRDSEIQKDQLLQTTTLSFDEIDTVDFTNDAEHLITIDLASDFGDQILSDFEADSSAMRPLGFVIEPTSGSGLVSVDMTSQGTEIGLLMRGKLMDTLGVYKKDTLFTAVTFTLNSAASNYFTKVDRDRSAALFSSVTDKMENDPSGDFVYFNTLAGIFPKISLDPIIEFATNNEGVLFNLVTMEIPVESNEEFIPHTLFSRFYFAQVNGSQNSINWPATLTSPDYFGTTMQTDAGYTSSAGTVVLANDTIREDPEIQLGFSSSLAVFWQHIYDNVQDDLDEVDIDDRPFIRGYLTGVDNLVMIPGQVPLLGRNAIDKESIVLKVYYTQLKE